MSGHHLFNCDQKMFKNSFWVHILTSFGQNWEKIIMTHTVSEDEYDTPSNKHEMGSLWQGKTYQKNSASLLKFWQSLKGA